MMHFDDAIQRFGLQKALPEFYAACQQAPAAANDDGRAFLPWLEEEFLHDMDRQWLRLPPPALQALLEAAAMLAAEPELCRLAACARWLLFQSGRGVDELAAMGFPRPSLAPQLLNDLFGLLVHLSGMPLVEERYRSRGIPLEVMQASYGSVRIWMESFLRFYGRWGHDRECPRMLYIENFRFIRIGRLEYEMGCLSAQLHAFRSRRDGSVVVASAGGVRINSAGHVAGTNGEVLPVLFETIFDEDELSWLANPATADGAIEAQPVRLPKAEWEHFACPGSRCIGVHIPRDGRLDTQAARESLKEAVAFFRSYFPEWRFQLFQCHSWLLDPVYRQMMGEDSNIVRFQRLFRCLPEKSTDFGALISVFTEAPFDIQAWQPTSTLQRLLQERYAEGKKVAAAAGIIPVSDLN